MRLLLALTTLECQTHRVCGSRSTIVSPVASRDPRLPAVVALVAVGGAAGACLRYGTSVLLPHDPTQWPVATFAVNILGCLLMGLFLGLIVTHERVPPHLAPLLATGFLGGLTTFSTFAGEIDQMATAGATATAGLYVVLSVGLGVLAVRLGWIMGRLGGAP